MTSLMVSDCKAKQPEWFGLVVGPGPYGRFRRVTPAGSVRRATIGKPTLTGGIDEFYTKEEIAARLWKVLSRFLDLDDVLLVEPSAGKGSFFKLMRGGRLGFDLILKCDGVIEADFLSIQIESEWRIVFVGNPPFGIGARLAIQFFNHAAKMATFIAMILPRSFQKGSIQNQLDRFFHLIHEELVPTKAFLREGKLHNVPTVFQIWQRRDELRELQAVEKTHPDFIFTTADKADFELRRNGSTAGTIPKDIGFGSKSHYFIKALRGDVRTIMENIDFSDVASRVTGPKSISMPEVVTLYKAAAASRSASSSPSTTLARQRLRRSAGAPGLDLGGLLGCRLRLRRLERGLRLRRRQRATRKRLLECRH